jgi:DNA-binding MarR family transcriptional regulator
MVTRQRLSLSLRLNATGPEVHQTLRAMEDAGLIEQVRDAGLIPMWQLP